MVFILVDKGDTMSLIRLPFYRNFVPSVGFQTQVRV